MHILHYILIHTFFTYSCITFTPIQHIMHTHNIPNYHCFPYNIHITPLYTSLIFIHINNIFNNIHHIYFPFHTLLFFYHPSYSHFHFYIHTRTHNISITIDICIYTCLQHTHNSSYTHLIFSGSTYKYKHL